MLRQRKMGITFLPNGFSKGWNTKKPANLIRLRALLLKDFARN